MRGSASFHRALSRPATPSFKKQVFLNALAICLFRSIADGGYWNQESPKHNARLAPGFAAVNFSYSGIVVTLLFPIVMLFLSFDVCGIVLRLLDSPVPNTLSPIAK